MLQLLHLHPKMFALRFFVFKERLIRIVIFIVWLAEVDLKVADFWGCGLSIETSFREGAVQVSLSLHL